MAHRAINSCSVTALRSLCSSNCIRRKNIPHDKRGVDLLTASYNRRLTIMSSQETEEKETQLTHQSTIEAFVTSLAAKQPTPGGGAAAAVGASIGAAAASMAAAYTQRKKDETSGAASHARALQEALKLSPLLDLADADAKAYASLQKTWKKDHGLTEDQVQAVQEEALRVPTDLVVACHRHILEISNFLQFCNPNITSDAKVGIHQLAGASRAAYQTVLVNSPPEAEKLRLKELLKEIHRIEHNLLELDD